jgi:hypothetical protein
MDHLGFRDGIDSFERSSETDDFGWRAFLSAQFGQFRRQKRLLSLAAQPARDTPPENKLLKLDPFAWICETVGMKPPEFVDPGAIPRGAESGAKKKSGKDQPGFFVFDRLFAARDALVQHRPERANEHPVPIGFGQSKDFLEAFEKVGGREFVPPIERPGKERLNACPSRFQPGRINSGINGGLFTSVTLFFFARFVRAQVKLEGPRLVLVRIGAHTGDLE